MADAGTAHVEDTITHWGIVLTHPLPLGSTGMRWGGLKHVAGV